MRPALDATRPLIVTVGLICLDILRHLAGQAAPYLGAGGSAGNVAAIAAALGWHSLPLARLNKEDPAFPLLQGDLQRAGADPSLLQLTPTARRVPLIAQRNGQDKQRQRDHSFSIYCTRCGNHLPRLEPLRKDTMARLLLDLPAPQVLYLDRAAPSAVMLARAARQRGALVVFEPSGVGKQKRAVELFNQVLAQAHIFKYSAHRLGGKVSVTAHPREPLLEIETLGADGLRYRTRNHPAWATLPAIKADRVVDSAGSGDWSPAPSRPGISHPSGCRSVGRSSWSLAAALTLRRWRIQRWLARPSTPWASPG